MHCRAEKLGATPTGHLEKAAQSVLHSSTSDSAAVSISSPGISRAFQSLTIVPKRARALTIPMHSVAYGKRASEVARSIPLHREGDALVGDVMGTRTVFYALKRRVTIPQERALLPTDEKLVESVERGIKNTIRLILANPEG